jgi:bifunctional non-homologous end joining protein LigD
VRSNLRAYREKRDFRRTPEPGGRVHRGDRFSFVVQKHHARRLHYDFRLELDGVLKSWAIPKGPSLNPQDKRLAAHVEDHPLEYGGFEGVIPQGEYGGGKVILWDRGVWIPEGEPHEGYRKGHLKFRLEGSKLKGSWHLVRMKPRDPREKDKNWLLIKDRDEAASEVDITQSRPESVLNTTGPPRVWHPDRSRRAPSRQKGRAGAMPEFVEPQLATLVERPPEGPEWVHEIKFDGYRVLCRIEGPRVTLTTRHGKDWTASFPTLVGAAQGLRVRDAILDGEIVVLDERGVSSFQALQNALGHGREKEIVYQAFDLISLDGVDLRTRPLVERKEALARVLEKAPATIRYTDHIEGRGGAFFEKSCEFALEGIVSKLRDAPYRSGRSREWLKTKCLGRQEFVIAGYTDPEGARSGFGALLLGVHDKDGTLRYAGRVGTGFSDRTLEDLTERLKKLHRDRSSFDKPLPSRVAKGVHWVEPKLVAEVAFSEWTADGILRQARYEGLREDKPAAEVAADKPAPPTAEPRDAFAGVRLTHPDKVLYPDAGITKRDLAEYYASISDWALPHLVGRPISIVRCPEGQGKACFYQKHAHAGTPEVIRRVRIPEGTGTRQGVGTYVYIDGLPGLIALVQMGVLELHPWGSRVETLERPDRMTIDLDPAPEVPPERVEKTALAMRARLEEIGLQSFAKTTGGKGLHVVVPLRARTSWDELKAFSRAVVEEFVRAAPDRFVATMTKSKRAGKIFLDFFRNTRGATAVAAYSTRARPGAPVSTPVGWDELPSVGTGAEFTVRTVPGRLRRLKADPWKGFHEVRQELTAKICRAVGLSSLREYS